MNFSLEVMNSVSCLRHSAKTADHAHSFCRCAVHVRCSLCLYYFTNTIRYLRSKSNINQETLNTVTIQWHSDYLLNEPVKKPAGTRLTSLDYTVRPWRPVWQNCRTALYFIIVRSKIVFVSGSCPVPGLSLTPAHRDWNPAGKDRVQDH